MNLNSDLFSTSSQSEILKTSWTCCIYIQNVQRLPKKKLKSFQVMQLATWSASSPLVTTLTSSPSTVFLAQSAPACSTGLLDVPWPYQAKSPLIPFIYAVFFWKALLLSFIICSIGSFSIYPNVIMRLFLPTLLKITSHTYTHAHEHACTYTHVRTCIYTVSPSSESAFLITAFFLTAAL